jgi:tetratricopeptide (TPR) repeat protein
MVRLEAESDDDSFKSFHDDEPSPPPLAKQPPPEHSLDSRQAEKEPIHKRNPSKPDSDSPAEKIVVERYPPDEEAALLKESNDHKTAGNTLFGKGSFENAVQNYDRALSSCPNYLDYELAVLRSNVAACHLKLSEWKEAITSAEKGVDCLERLEPLPRIKKPKPEGGNATGSSQPQAPQSDENTVEEVDDDLAARIENLEQSGHTLDEVRRLQIKLLMRRAKARSELGGWAALQGAEEDYTTLLNPAMAGVLTATDKRTVVDSLRKLAPRINTAREEEMAEMMGKLKGLGNSILKPFGLSTENFQFTKDPNSGGYSMNFNQSAGKK